MEVFIAVLVLLIGILASNILSRIITFIPVPLIQIIIGIILSSLPMGIHMTLEPELFMVLFIAPLLYNDGKMTSKEELWEIRSPIILMALGLVLVTVVVVGYVISWLIPEMPMSACFALAAILSPTDAVAVSSLSERVKLPKSIMALLEGEALMNDASGLVAFKFAIAATVTGVFSITHATTSFFIIALGGLFSGVLISFLISKLSSVIRRVGLEDVTFHMLIQLITPFIIYLISEEIGVSGILAVVSGGIVYSITAENSEPIISKLKFVSRSTWSVVLFIINGLVFLILGLQIPDAMFVILRDDAVSNLKLSIYILVITATLILLRFLWVYVFWKGKPNKDKEEKKNSRLFHSLLTSLSGVRGAVTLAGAFSIPFYLNNGASFPQRDLIIFIAAGVILVTIIMASAVLPIIAKEEDEEKEKSTFNEKAFIKVIDTAIEAINEETSDDNKAAAKSLIYDYRRIKSENLSNKEEIKLTIQDRRIGKDIFKIGMEAEYLELKRLLEHAEFPSEIISIVKERIRKIESSLSRNPSLGVYDNINSTKRTLKRLFNRDTEVNNIDMECIKKIKIKTSKAAIKAIESQINEENRNASMFVIEYYKTFIRRLLINDKKDSESLNKQKTELQFKALQMARNKIQNLLENNKINRETANKLRSILNYMEATNIGEELFLE